MRHRQRNHARDVHATKTGLKSHNPAQRCRYSNGSPGVRANTAKTKSRSYCARRTSTRTSRNSRRIPGISCRPIVRIVSRDAVSKLMHVGLAQQNRSSQFQARNNRRIFFGKIVAKNFRSRRGSNALGANIVFQRNGNAMQKPAIGTRFTLSPYTKFRFSPLRLPACHFMRHRDVGV